MRFVNLRRMRQSTAQPRVRLGSLGHALLLLSATIWHTATFASPALLNPQKIAAGNFHFCAIVNGGAQCWGYNSYGQIGSGDFLDSATPVPVVGLASGVTAIAAGGRHTCAIVGGGVRCWGYNSDGELGDGTLDDSAIPVPVQGLTSGVIALAAGQYHTCAIVTGGSVRCWGWNANGQLGNNTTTATNTSPPVTVSNIPSGATALAGGGYHTCAIVAGGVKCWGYNADGELDDGSQTERHVPVPAGGLTANVLVIAAGFYHNCALINGGTVRCWGWNPNGQLGDGTINATNANPSVAVSGIASGATAIATGGYFSCAVVNGAAKCWGSNYLGELGDGTLVEHHTPMSVTGLGSGVSAIAAGSYTTCAQATVGGANQAQCWGDNVDGEVGLGDLINRYEPHAIATIASGATALALGADAHHTCAIVGGAAKCWGGNYYGAIGDGSNLHRSTPVVVTGLTSGVTTIATGTNHSCAIAGGAAMCWGDNYFGELGNGTYVSTNTPVTAIASGVTAIAAGFGHTCAIVGTGVKCWGANANGELGNASTNPSPSPVSVGGLSTTPIAISAGVAHTCVVLSNGKIQCWGYNSNGQLGNNGTTSTLANPPVLVSNITSGATAIAAGGYSTCAIVSGGAQCWGSGQYGQLGNSQYLDSYVPAAVSGLSSGVAAIAAGDFHACAVVGGAASCWGEGYEGQLGNGSIDEYDVPVAVIGLGAGVTALTGAASHGCALVNGAVKCWGSDFFGELGDGRAVFTQSPAAVVASNEIFSSGFEAQ